MIAAVALLVAAPVAAHIGPSVRELVEVADVEALAAWLFASSALRSPGTAIGSIGM